MQRTMPGELIRKGDDAMRRGRPEEAADAYAQAARTSAHDRLRALCGLSAASLELNEIECALASACAASKCDPNSPQALFALGKSYVAKRDFAAAHDVITLAVARRRASAPQPTARITIPAHYGLHNLEQLDRLIADGGISVDSVTSHRTTSSELQAQLRAMIGESTDEPPWISVTGKDAVLLADIPYRRAEILPATEAINSRVDLCSLDASLQRAPAVAVVDDFLTPQALGVIQAFCMDSTVWRRPYPRGYIGAFPENGFCDPTLFKLVAELFDKIPGVFSKLRLTQWWCFVYDAELSGTDIHADDADLTVNLWITPDGANREPGGGGIHIWNAIPPADWSFEQMNAGGETIRSLLARQSAERIDIPYRENRAVFFEGHLFHETAPARFHYGFTNRRRNISLLFRRRPARARA